jgi:hypothetical protein
MTPSRRSPCWLAILLLLATSCGGSDSAPDNPEVRASVLAGLTSGRAGIERDQARTFQADVRSGWAAAFDPADPPGCVPGGLRDGSAKSCTAYVLRRSKTRWSVVATGRPGSLALPDGVPSDLGSPDHLAWLSE